MRSLPMRPEGRRIRAGMLVGMLLLVACSGDDVRPAELFDAEFVRAAYTLEPPYAFLDSLGRVTGESPIALRGALATLGVDSIRWVRMPFDELLPSLEQGRVDVVASGLYPTPERRSVALFTRSTSCSGSALAVRRGAGAPTSLQGLASTPDARLAVLRGTVEERAAGLVGIKADRLVVVPDPVSGLDAVRQGLADGFALSQPSLRTALSDDADLEVHTYEPPPSVAGMVAACSALAVRRDAGELAVALDRGLGAFIGSDAHRRQVEPLGFSVPDPVMRPTPDPASAP